MTFREPTIVYAFKGDSLAQEAYRDDIVANPEQHAIELHRHLLACAAGSKIVRLAEMQPYGKAIETMREHAEPETWQILSKAVEACVTDPRYEAWAPLITGLVDFRPVTE
jgi:hypothetical protein